MKNQKLKILFLIIFLTVLFLPLVSQAAGLVPCGDPGEPPCELCHLFVLFKNIVDFLLFKIVPPLAILMLVIAGSMYILAYLEVIGDPKWISQSKSLIWSVVIGLIIIYGAWLIVNLFFQLIGISTEAKNPFRELPQNWWKINCP